MNADYAAISFEGKVNLHMVCFIFPNYKQYYMYVDKII